VTDSIAFLFIAFCAIFWASSVGLLVVSVAATLIQPWLAERRATREDRPPVTVVLPVKLLDDSFVAAQESALAQNYPQFDVVVCATEASSPAVETMREILARHPQLPSKIIHSTARFAASPKVDNLFRPFLEAENDVIFMKDSNVVLQPDDLSEAMRHLTDRVGLVCAIPHTANAENFAALVESAIVSGPHMRMLYSASVLGQGFGVGKIMLFRRSDFLRAGGFAAIAHTVGEDNAMAKAMKRIGLSTVFTHRSVRQDLGRRSFQDVYFRQLRWSVVRRDDELLSFLAEPFCQALPSFAAAYLLAPHVGVAPLVGVGATAGFWLTMETLLSWAKGWQVSWEAPAIFVAREALMLAVWLHAWFETKVVWAQSTIDTRAGETDAPAAAPVVEKEG
jgi:ceramide glucosyltransferase